MSYGFMKLCPGTRFHMTGAMSFVHEKFRMMYPTMTTKIG